MRKKTLLKRMSDAIRRRYWLSTNGPVFQIYGLSIVVGEDIPWDTLKQIVRGHYEQAEKRLIERHLDRNAPVVELGGSIGVISALLRKTLAPGVPLTIVEANPSIVGLCRRNAQGLDPADTSKVINAAISYDGEAVRFSTAGDYLSGKLAAPEDAAIVVPATTLAAVSAGLDAYTLVMDIEGAEYDVFARDGQALQRCRRAFVEIHPDADRSEARFFELAAACGFRLIDRDQDVVVLDRI
jgi:FkbM family methyltransferase